MKIRQDAWTDENDLLLAETVLRHVREGSTQLNAFEEVGDKLNRTSAACGFRWNAVVRHNYEKALQLAKKQRKQRHRILGKEQSGKKKLLYSPPEPSFAEIETVDHLEIPAEVFQHEMSEELTNIPEQPVAGTQAETGAKLNLSTVIAYLQSINHSNLHAEILKSENERLKREIADLKSQNEELRNKLGNIEENATSMQEDYETLMKIMNKARKLALFEEEERSTTKFKMDRNGNLEKVAE
ncbi:RsfA family transcriptional regulator [Bacillus benzoevorans]|uniref:Prespore-specific regulator n=1 Tax=Bacillus benzoevorans TaxID=1456 RepID=A0A7X0LWI1_9BACI|nr:RsfA family transcriptional regulator [Bacillus benzoevorans]MBB6445527.1 prespore-specific regulator [Bacillus benzoevorans]